MKLILQHSLSDLDATQWNALIRTGQPFLSHEFLTALESRGCIGGATGWQPHYLLAEEDGRLLGALPMFLKQHSFGEFVFDWAWAGAHERHGIPYYPKLVVAVPFTPVSGERILISPSVVDRPALAGALIDAALAHARDLGVSSLHWLFINAEEATWLGARGCLLRSGCQFHWDNPGYADFDAFLAQLSSRHRKEVRRERRAVRGQGIEIEHLQGDEISDETWDTFYRCYLSTFLHKGNSPPLTRGFFGDLGRLGSRVLLIMARRDGRHVAGALFFRDEDALYGRHWGALGDFPHLHFELCYYQAIDYCIARGLRRFEAGAQGEYKVRRGFRPTLTRSAHWIADPRFEAAIGDFLVHEHSAVDAYVDEMQDHLPFREPA